MAGCGTEVLVRATRPGRAGKVQAEAESDASGWIDELNAMRISTSLPATWTPGTIYSGGASGSVAGCAKNPPTPVIPKPGVSARNLLAASGEAAHSPRDNTSARNDNSLRIFKLRR